MNVSFVSFMFQVGLNLYRFSVHLYEVLSLQVLDWLTECALGTIERLNANDPLAKEWEPLLVKLHVLLL